MSTTSPLYTYSCKSMRECKHQLLFARHPLKLGNGHTYPLRALDVTVRLHTHVPGADTFGEGCGGDMWEPYMSSKNYQSRFLGVEVG